MEPDPDSGVTLQHISMKKLLALAVLAAALPIAALAAAPAPENAAPAADTHAKGTAPLHISHGQTINIKDYLVPGKITVFDFYSEYCPPCRRLSPLLVKLHEGRADVAVVKVDINRPGVAQIDWASPVAQQFGLESIPHLKVYNADGTLNSEGDAARELVVGWIMALDKS
jgi:thiol-disulfide isomerase/thioredoxin